nr:DUF485 domain-containing protein [Thermomonospora echinospora]
MAADGSAQAPGGSAQPARGPLHVAVPAFYLGVTPVTAEEDHVTVEKDLDRGGTPYERVQRSPEFQELRRRFRAFVFPATVAFLTWYLLYVVLSGWARGFMGTQIVGFINVALIFGLLQFVSTFLIAWLYARHAEAKLDPMAAELGARVEGEGK